MGAETSIGWADGTASYWRGCVECSPGCLNCFAKTQSLRNPTILGTWGAEGAGGVRSVCAPDYWEQALRIDRKAKQEGRRFKMFCGSIKDVFEQWEGPMHDHKGRVLKVSEHGMWGQPEDEKNKSWRLLTMDDIRVRLFSLIQRTPNIDWLLLTKRTKDVLATLRRIGDDHRREVGGEIAGNWAEGKYPQNVWVGGSVENQQTLWLRAEHLREIPAKLRFISAEPLLGPLDFRPWFGRKTGLLQSDPFDWAIVGGESGNNARECHVDWIRGVVRQCKEHSIPVFVKQMGSRPMCETPNGLIPLPLWRDGKGEDIRDFPNDLRVQEFPDLEWGDAGV